MSITHSKWLLCAYTAAMALSPGCGSDFGGDPPSDASITRDAATDAAGDGARQLDADASGTSDSAEPRGDADETSGPDTGVSPDSSIAPDAMAEGGAGSDVRGTRTDATDARLDISREAGGSDTVTSDTVEGGPTNADGPVGPGCGNRLKEMGEECDDGNGRDFDGCSSFCTDRRACDCCVEQNYGRPWSCEEVDGDAEAGPKAGTPKAQLCRELYACVLKSRCGFTNQIGLDCYCGDNKATPDGSCSAAPAGPCIAEMEAGMETEGATWQDKIKIITNRLSDAEYGGGKMMERWLYEHTACPDDCRQPAQWVYCSNPDGQDGGMPDADATMDRGFEASIDTSAPDISAPPDISVPPDVGPTDTGGSGAVDGATVDKDCHDCLIAATLDPFVCDTLTGTAAGGPAAGVSKQQLCWEALSCIHRTTCHGNASHECYCGTAIDLGTCLSTTSQATGVCKTELDRSLEVPPGSAGSVALDRFVDTAYAGGHVGIIATIEGTDPLWQSGCRHVCIPYTPTHGRDQ